MVGIGRTEDAMPATNLIALTGMITAVGSVVGTISTMVLAWRADRRTAKEAELKLVQLQQQIRELELKLTAPSGTQPKELSAGS